MPPKKAKSKAKAGVKIPTRSTSTAAPPNVVTSRGKEYDTIAAAARPRRATTETTTTPLKVAAKRESTCRDEIGHSTHN